MGKVDWPPTEASQQSWNLRDVADAWPDGLLRGRLYRGGAFKREQPAADFLAMHPNGAVIDLRSPHERTEADEAIYFQHRDRAGLVFTAEGRSRHFSIDRSEAVSANKARERMLLLYEALPFDENILAGVRIAIGHLAETPHPVLILCAHGKDRTGVAAALILSVVGAPREVVEGDYLRSASASGLASLAEKMQRDASAYHGCPVQVADVLPYACVDKAYLTHALAATAVEPGGWDHYLQQTLGVGPALVDRLLTGLIFD